MKNHHIYSDNFVLSVVDLTCIDLATEEDRLYHINDWARLFKATTWEEVKKMAQQNEYLQEASRSIFQFNTDEQMRKLCRDRVEYYQDLRNYERYIKQQDSVIAKLTVEKDAAIAKLTAEKDATIAELTAERDAAIAALQSQIQSLTDQLQNSPANREPAKK